jgi:CHAT domain
VSAVRTVTLELLRHGSDHNQLLSPLTPYLALSGNHDAETVHVQLEHMQLFRQLSDLRYPGGRSAGEVRLRDASAEVTRILSSIRSLAAELSGSRGDERLVHLRLVLSAAELAMLPFELCNAPQGFPGQGQWLSLQAIRPIVLTREVRRVAPASIPWPERPRVLVAAASPAGVADVPLRQLLLAFRQSLAPWMSRGGAGELEKHLTVIPNASLQDIYRACAAEAYTHVHILAHGLRVAPDGEGMTTYGLALHAEGDPSAKDVVTGERLAAALRAHRDGGTLSGPAVVTLASCDSGNVGSVITPGASIAHHLHEAGIPLVLASQFPLSFKGAAILAKTLYSGLFWGDDPRSLVHELRQELCIRCPETHDWASLVAYAALPADIDRQLQRASLRRRRLAVDKAMARIDLARGAAPTAEEDLEADRSLRLAMDRLASTVPPAGAEEYKKHRDSLGRLASAEKRHAQILARRAAALGASAPEKAAEARAESLRVLTAARDHYREAFRLDMSASWALVQLLALDVALGSKLDVNQWVTARGIAAFSIQYGDAHQAQAAWGALCELYVLAQLLPEGHESRTNAREAAEEAATALFEKARMEDAYSVKQQLNRYAEWWWADSPDLRSLPADLAKHLEARGVPAHWDWT